MGQKEKVLTHIIFHVFGSINDAKNIFLNCKFVLYAIALRTGKYCNEHSYNFFLLPDLVFLPRAILKKNVNYTR